MGKNKLSQYLSAKLTDTQRIVMERDWRESARKGDRNEHF